MIGAIRRKSKGSQNKIILLKWNWHMRFIRMCRTETDKVCIQNGIAYRWYGSAGYPDRRWWICQYPLETEGCSRPEYGSEILRTDCLGRKVKEMSKQKSSARTAVIVLGIIFCFVLVALLVCYFLTASYYAKHFFPGTVLNGIAVDKMTVEETEDKVAQEVADYVLSIHTRDGENYQISGSDIDYVYVPGTEISDILEEQENYQWITKRSGTREENLEVSATFNEHKLDQLVAGLGCFQEKNITRPKDAYLKETEDGYELVKAVKGNQLKLAKVQKMIRSAVDDGETEVTLPDSMYEEPSVKSDDERLNQALSEINSYLDTTIKYDVGENGEVLDRKTVKNWITVGADYSVTFDESGVTGFIQYLASKYNTYGDVRDFKTSLGDTVKIGGGDYGWVIDKEKEKEKLMSEIRSGKTIEREPVFNQTAVVKSEIYDIGDTYVEIDYTNQHMYYYKNGSLKLEADVVTGNIAYSNGSPDGVYKIVYKERDATLTGEDYASDVSYFMVFAYNVGFHDASWRSEFGKQIYKSSGSHGCINMPVDKATQLYQILEIGTPVVAYYREPVQLTAENAKISNAYSYRAG